MAALIRLYLLTFRREYHVYDLPSCTVTVAVGRRLAAEGADGRWRAVAK